MKYLLTILCCLLLTACSKERRLVIFNDTDKTIYVLKSDLSEQKLEPHSSLETTKHSAVQIRVGDKVYSRKLDLGKKFFKDYAQNTLFSYQFELKHEGFNQLFIKRNNDDTWQPL